LGLLEALAVLLVALWTSGQATPVPTVEVLSYLWILKKLTQRFRTSYGVLGKHLAGFGYQIAALAVLIMRISNSFEGRLAAVGA
jgi:hypothetical protein